MPLAKIFMAFIAALAALAVAAIVSKVAYKLYNRSFSHSPEKDALNKMLR